MGRPPIGKQAMSGSERQRRYLARLIRDAKHAAKPAKPDGGEWAKENERQWRAMWQAEGRSLADYKAGLEDQESDVWQWRRAKGKKAVAAERADWLRDHPGKPLPEHLCSLTEAQGAEYDAWMAKRAKRVQAAEMQAENAALKKELAQAKARIVEMAAARASTGGVARTSAPRRDSEDAPRRGREGDIQAYQRELGRTRELLAKAEAKLATTPPAERDRLVERLKTENRNLKTKVRETVKHYDERHRWLDAGVRAMKMPQDTYNAVIKCLHPDERTKRTPKQLDEACGLFTQWKKDQDARARKT